MSYTEIDFSLSVAQQVHLVGRLYISATAFRGFRWVGGFQQLASYVDDDDLLLQMLIGLPQMLQNDCQQLRGDALLSQLLATYYAGATSVFISDWRAIGAEVVDVVLV